MFDRLLLTGGTWQNHALNVCIQATFLLALAAIAVLVLRWTSAALRHRIWALTFVALLLLPVVNLLLPGWSLGIIPQAPLAAAVAMRGDQVQVASHTLKVQSLPPEIVASSSPTNALDAPVPLEANDSSRVERQQRLPLPSGSSDTQFDSAAASELQLPVAKWLATVWLVGMAVVLLPLATGVIGNLHWKRRGKRLFDAAWQRLLDDQRERLEIHREVTLIAGDPAQMPMTFGWLHPFVVLPNDASVWPAERRQMVLLHELAHVKRFDVAWQMVARFGCALYWFHPLVWYGVRRMRLEREHACDDCVLVAGQKASNYASQLLEIARAHRACSPLASAALSMARPSQLEGRLLAVLDAHRSRAALSTPRAIGLLAAALLLVIGLGTLRPTVQADTPGTAATQTATNATGSASDPSDQLTITGTVLSPQGKPVAAATAEIVGYEWYPWRRNLPGEDEVEYYRTTTDAAGRFKFVVPRNTSKSRHSVSVIAAAPDYAVTEEHSDLKSRQSVVDLVLKLNEPKTARIRLVDAVGNPVVGVTPQIHNCELEGEKYLSMDQSRGKIFAWPKCSASDQDGYVSVDLPATTKTLSVAIEDDRLGSFVFRDLPVGEQPAVIALKPARILRGKVLAADTGAPISGGSIAMMEPPYRRVPIAEDGSFRLAHTSNLDTQLREGESIIHIYPPADSPYLFYAQEYNWSKNDLGDSTVEFKLQRGMVVEGKVIEKGSGRPVTDARVYFESQEYNNKFYRDSSHSRYSGAGMKYRTDENGYFRLPVLPGPGYLFVTAPTQDYVHVMVSQGDKYYGKTGLGREYYDGALRIELKPDETPQPLTIELRRGVTLRRKVVQPDGQPAMGFAYARSYLPEENNIANGGARGLPIEDGELELPGFDPEQSNPLFILDLKHHCAATVRATAAEVDLNSPPIRLEPCGAAKFHVINDKGEVVDYDPRPGLIVTPGTAADHFIRPNQPLWADHIIWQNIGFRYPAKPPKTDTQGNVTVPDLIPGATYRLSFVNKQGEWDNGYEFTIRSGETTDIGEVVIPRHE